MRVHFDVLALIAVVTRSGPVESLDEQADRQRRTLHVGTKPQLLRLGSPRQLTRDDPVAGGGCFETLVLIETNRAVCIESAPRSTTAKMSNSARRSGWYRC